MACRSSYEASYLVEYIPHPSIWSDYMMLLSVIPWYFKYSTCNLSFLGPQEINTTIRIGSGSLKAPNSTLRKHAQVPGQIPNRNRRPSYPRNRLNWPIAFRRTLGTGLPVFDTDTEFGSSLDTFDVLRLPGKWYI